jgi:adenosylcobinamide-phosphate synthase
MMSNWAIASIPLAALLVDAVVGDPHSSLHPVALIGRLISWLEKHLYVKGSAGNQMARGAVLTVLTVGIVYGLSRLILHLSAMAGDLCLWAVSVLLLYISICPRALLRDGLAIYRYLKAGNLHMARKRTSWIVGRDTDKLTVGEVVRAVVETVAENTTDGVTGPLFWYLLLGPAGAMAYRAVNTLDSMVGYKSERYMYFGRPSARLDDLCGWIPARITFILFCLSSLILGLDARKAWEIGRRDAPSHPSPNGGWAEAPAAGALHIQLGGLNTYGGVPEYRAVMGDPIEPLQPSHILKMMTLMYTSSILFALALGGWEIFVS